MATIVFDSYALAKRLKEAGFTEQQAEVLIEAAKDAMLRPATKEDLDLLRKDLTRNLAIGVGVMLAAAVGIIVGLLRPPGA